MLIYHEELNKDENYYWLSYSILLDEKIARRIGDDYIYTKDGEEFREIIDKSEALRKGMYCGKIFPFINF